MSQCCILSIPRKEHLTEKRCFFSFKSTAHKTLLVCVDQEEQHIFKFNRSFCVYRLNVSSICHNSGRKYVIAKIRHKFCESSVTDGRLPFYCGWTRVWLLKAPLHKWSVYVFWSVCGIFTHQPNPADIMTTKCLCLRWIRNFTNRIWFLLDTPLEFPLSSFSHVFFMLWNELKSIADTQVSGCQCWSDSIEKLMMLTSFNAVKTQKK